ncbi:CopG family transcriptional regulator [Streptomyces sioyaensis]|uniref:ribbon-helix-helix protein, CopG family n=1 Tax=Streptomyces sioyaensis TaxID=67364 RepID=UPI001F481AD9|nr:ribbon-helix-helix protein, CopG family [Streptomyces sioyaensis]MCF3172547.1 CopG family transcriptional regulator [Streptomyces sioyaensis]
MTQHAEPTGAQGETGVKDFTRLSVNINDDTAEALKRLKSAKGISITEAVRRAVALYDLVDRETGDTGKLQIVDDGNVREILLLG